MMHFVSVEMILAETASICHHPRRDLGMEKGLILRMIPFFGDIADFSRRPAVWGIITIRIF